MERSRMDPLEEARPLAKERRAIREIEDGQWRRQWEKTLRRIKDEILPNVRVAISEDYS